MAKAASSGTATDPAPVPTRQTGNPGRPDEIDADAIRRTFTRVLRAAEPVPGEDQERIGALLLGHMQLLVPELTAAVPRLHGEWRRAAVHVLGSANRLLAADLGTSEDDLDRMATQCRALLSLRLKAAPLACLVAQTTEGPCS